MFNRKGNDAEALDAVAREIAKSAALADNESDAAVSSPLFLFRVRARIDREKSSRRAERDLSVAPVIGVGGMKLAFSGLMLAAAIFFWAVWIPSTRGQASEAERRSQQPLTACSISATSACAITTGDVLELLLSNSSQELPK